MNVFFFIFRNLNTIFYNIFQPQNDTTDIMNNSIQSENCCAINSCTVTCNDSKYQLYEFPKYTRYFLFNQLTKEKKNNFLLFLVRIHKHIVILSRNNITLG